MRIYEGGFSPFSAFPFSAIDKRLNNIESDLKSFKVETRDSSVDPGQKIDDIGEVVVNNHDKRIEALEEAR